MGWNDCGCSTLYTDAWGNAINGAGSGSDGNVGSSATCDPNWGLLAFMGLAALLGVMAAGHSNKKAGGHH